MMRERFCGFCGADLIEHGVIEVELVYNYANVDISEGQRVYDGNNETYYDTAEFVRYDCNACDSPLNDRQIDDIRQFPMEGGYVV